MKDNEKFVCGADEQPDQIHSEYEETHSDERRDSCIFSEGIHSDIYDISWIGAGFMGRVYKVHDKIRDEDFVCKMYRKTSIPDIPFFVKADLRLNLMSLRHKNLCRVIDIKVGSRPRMLMDYLDGSDLEQYTTDKIFGISAGLDVIKQVLSGLQALHDRNIFYGDVTPRNIMISNGTVYLCDFSCSNYNDSEYGDRTEPLGRYRSPEKKTGNKIDFRSDIYEAGLLLDALTLRIMNCSLRYAAEKADGYSPLESHIFNIIRKAAMYRPEERYASAAEMMEDIEKAEELLP